jgi:hypothetical protein
MTAKGIWKARKGLDPATKTAVAAELLAALKGATPTQAPAEAPVTSAPPPPAHPAAVEPPAPATTASPAPSAAPPPPPPAAPAVPASDPNDFGALMTYVSGLQTENKLNTLGANQVAEAVLGEGKTLRDLPGQPDKIPAYREQLDDWLKQGWSGGF